MKQSTAKQLKGYGRYSGLAFQMAIIIALAVFGGLKLDEHWNTKPIFTVVCALLGIAVALYTVIKDFLPKKKA